MPSREKLQDLKTQKLFLASSKLSCGRHVRLTLWKSGQRSNSCYFRTRDWDQTRKLSYRQTWPGLSGRSSEGALPTQRVHTAVGSPSSSEAGGGGFYTQDSAPSNSESHVLVWLRLRDEQVAEGSPRMSRSRPGYTIRGLAPGQTGRETSGIASSFRRSSF